MRYETDTRETRLRGVLWANAGFSTAAAVVLVCAGGALSTEFGLASPSLLTQTGISLVVFAVFLIATATRPRLNRRDVAVYGVLDVLWVVYSVVVLIVAGPDMTGAGVRLVAAAAVVVGILGVLQLNGLRRRPSATAA